MPLNSLDMIVKNQLIIEVWIYFCTLNSVPLICLSIPLSVPHLLWWLHLSFKFWCQECESSKFLFFFWHFIFLIYFNWRLITLQYCGGFVIQWHESAMSVHVFPILNPPSTSIPITSLWVTQCTSPEHPVSCIKPGLFHDMICFTYDNIHVSVLFSQIIPPSPSLTESKRLFYIPVSLLLGRI